MGIDKIKRSFIWMRNALRVIDKTTLPGEIEGTVKPTVDLFGWERFAPALVGQGPQLVTATGADATDVVVTTPVPSGVLHYVMFASCSHDDPAGLLLTMQVRTLGADIGVAEGDGNVAVNASPFRLSLKRPIILTPGDSLICRSVPAPAALTSLFVRYKFVALEFGEYIPAV